MKTQLRNLRVGDTFRMYPNTECPLQRIVAVRAPEFKPTSDVAAIRMMISGNVYTLERVDTPGHQFEITLDAMEDVYLPVTSGKNGAFWLPAFAGLLAALIILAVVL